MKLIVVTPAGRERYMRLLSHYVLGSPEVSEWHLWHNCRTPADSAYVRALVASDPRCRLKELPGAQGGFAIIGDFFRFCDDAEALYLRLDDDVVYLEPGFFPKFIARAEQERGKALWFSPIVINNAISAWMLKHFSQVKITGPISCQAMCPCAWASPNLPMALHPVFIEAVRRGRLEDFRVPDRTLRLSRFSINALGFFGAERMALGERFIAPNGNEEEWLSAILPAMLDRYGILFGNLVAAHFSFYPQEEALLRTRLLEEYYALAGLPPPVYERPQVKRKLKHRLMPWRKPRVDPGPQYTVALR